MEAKRKRKNYFVNQGMERKPKRRDRLALEPGMKGFLCTCNFRPKDCVREAYNLLNTYADKLYGSEDEQIVNNEEQSKEEEKNELNDEKKQMNNDEKNEENKDHENEKNDNEKKELEKSNNEHQENEIEEENKDHDNEKKELEKSNNEQQANKIKEKNEDHEKEKNDCEKKELEKSNNKHQENEMEEEDEDISTALNKEIDELKSEAAKSPSQKKFQVIDTSLDNVIFINSTIPDALEVVTAIVKDVHETKKQQSRYLLRLLPIQVVCKAYLDDIKSKAEILFEKYFSQEPKSFNIVFNRRNNGNLIREQVIEHLADIILKKNPGNKVYLRSPDIAVVVEIIRSMCLISIAPHYFKYKKYNLFELCNNKNC